MGQYIRHDTVELSEMLALIQLNWGARRARAILQNGYEVGVSSLRLQTFCIAAAGKKGIHYKACGLRAQYFAVESFAGSLLPSTHANLYGKKGDVEVLFTQDHVIPRSRGGKDNLNNSQVMCQPCNSRKGSRSDRKFKREVRQKC